MAQRQAAQIAARGATGPSTAELPSTGYALLGLLTFGEKSGYDLGKFVNETIAHFFFNPAKSQVYAELRRLVARGYATEREVAQRDRPDKRLYAITPTGRCTPTGYHAEVAPDGWHASLYSSQTRWTWE